MCQFYNQKGKRKTVLENRSENVVSNETCP